MESICRCSWAEISSQFINEDTQRFVRSLYRSKIYSHLWEMFPIAREISLLVGNLPQGGGEFPDSDEGELTHGVEVLFIARTPKTKCLREQKQIK